MVDDQHAHMREIDKIELIEVNSDSNASEFVGEDREMDLENTIIERINELVPPDNESIKLEHFNRMKKKQGLQERQNYMANKLIDVIRTREKSKHDHSEVHESIKQLN